MSEREAKTCKINQAAHSLASAGAHSLDPPVPAAVAAPVVVAVSQALVKVRRFVASSSVTGVVPDPAARLLEGGVSISRVASSVKVRLIRAVELAGEAVRETTAGNSARRPADHAVRSLSVIGNLVDEPKADVLEVSTRAHAQPRFEARAETVTGSISAHRTKDTAVVVESSSRSLEVSGVLALGILLAHPLEGDDGNESAADTAEPGPARAPPLMVDTLHLEPVLPLRVAPVVSTASSGVSKTAAGPGVGAVRSTANERQAVSTSGSPLVGAVRPHGEKSVVCGIAGSTVSHSR